MVCPSGMVLWNVDEKKNGLSHKDGMQGGWKGKMYTQEGWYGMGMKKIGTPKKYGMPRGWKEKGIYQRRMVKKTSSTFIHWWASRTYLVVFVIVVVVFTRSIRFCVRRGRRERALAFWNSGSCRGNEPRGVLLGEGGSFVCKGILWGKLAGERTKASSVVGERI